MDMKKFVDILLKQEDLKDIPITIISRVVSSVFRVLNNENVFYKEEL
jgi:hypothetical protein